jgi:hypothetical protein
VDAKLMERAQAGIEDALAAARSQGGGHARGREGHQQ